MRDLLRLTRPVNLLIIVATMLLMRYGVIGGNLERGLNDLIGQAGTEVQRDQLSLPDHFGPQMPLYLFVLLVLSTVLIAAAGNMINDYFDTRIDRINKPDQVIVGRTVKRRVAMTGHMVLSGLGLIIGMFVAWRSGMLKWALIPAFSIGALWMYSTSLKRRLIIGNVTVALLTALVPLTVGLYEIPLMKQAFTADPIVVGVPGDAFYGMEIPYRVFWYWFLAFTGFAFLSTLLRELQKDMADVKGDEAHGCRTIPIVWGMKWARTLALLHTGVIIVLLLGLRKFILHDTLSFWYIGIGIIAPLLVSAGFTWSATARAEFVRAGNVLKLAMVAAICFAAVIRFLP
ncbi:MAG: geranylgeranylglycerol-phosphate geranylgeranyltransferase [Flavobacteriales bacterium]